MKAIVATKYGSPDVLQLQEVEKPTPGDDRVLVKIRATSVNALDWHLLRGKPFLVRFMGFGLMKPKRKVLGADVAGIVEAVGKNVKRFHPGDEVFGNQLGCFAEYVSVREDGLALKPANLSFEAAAAVPVAAVTALQGLRKKGQLQPGQRVLILGASGGVGTFAVQIAKSLGAEVTAVCSTRNMEKVRSLGADWVIDYTKEDFTQKEQQYDLILVVNGRRSLSAYKHALRPNGRCVMIGGGSMAQLLGGRLAWPLISGGKGTKWAGVMADVTHEELDFLKSLLEAGKVVPVVEKRYTLSQVPDAIRYLEAGHAQGKLVITMEAGTAT
ncbi:MAG: NAD(P)-dependent alcohol dehydrogenase [Thermoplasmata archaeon]|jgi:NADPH:quinone reductase-like Zn-dependent oxidoreductase